MEYSNKMNNVLGTVAFSFGVGAYAAHSLSNGSGSLENIKSATSMFDYVIDYVTNFKIELTGYDSLRYSLVLVSSLLILLYVFPQHIILTILLLVFLFLCMLCYGVEMRMNRPRINSDATFDANKVLECLAEKRRRRNGSANGSRPDGMDH